MPVYIPPEILVHIFTFARGSPPTWEESRRSTTYYRPNPNATLLSASLVSKAWADAAQQVLYLHAIFTSRPQERTYTAWIESDARRRCRTVSMWIRPCTTQWAFARLLDTLQGVESLELGNVLPGAMLSWGALRNPGLKDLKVLSLPCSDYFIKFEESIAPLPFSLDSLAYQLFTDKEQETQLLSALLSASQKTLRTLMIRKSRNLYDILIPIPLPNLRHLVLEENTEGSSLGEAFKSYISLEKLELRGIRAFSEGYSLTGSYFDLTVGALPTPNSLRHLVIGIDEEDHICGVIKRLGHPALAGLEVLEFMNLRRSDVYAVDEEATLIETCKRRSITLVYADGPSSLSASCDASKMAYDTCFNHWFKSYLIVISPPLSAPASTPAGAEEREARARTIQAKRDEYERECGAKYEEYQKCVWAGIKKTDGLTEMVEKARKEDPLTGWGEVKVVKEEDLRA